MLGIEGNYDEIVDFLNDFPVMGVRWFEGHGIYTGQIGENGDAIKTNVGLFSVVEDHHGCFCEQQGDVLWSHAAATCNFSVTKQNDLPDDLIFNCHFSVNPI